MHKNPHCRYNTVSSNTTNQIGFGNDTATTSKDIDIDVSDGDLVKYQSMWNGALRSFRMTFDQSLINMIPRLNRALFEQVRQKLETISEKRSYKHKISLKVVFHQSSDQDLLT